MRQMFLFNDLTQSIGLLKLALTLHALCLAKILERTMEALKRFRWVCRQYEGTRRGNLKRPIW